jgi:hypothetical protein
VAPALGRLGDDEEAVVGRLQVAEEPLASLAVAQEGQEDAGSIIDCLWFVVVMCWG